MKVRERTNRIKALAADLGILTHEVEGLLAQRNQALAALAAVVAAEHAGEPHPEAYALPVLTRHGLAPAGTAPVDVLAAHALAQAALDAPGSVLRRAVQLPATLHAAEYGRWLIAAAGAEWMLPGDVLDDARSVLTELISNAAKHVAWHKVPKARREIGLVLSLAAGTLRIEVTDPDPTLPTAGQAPSITGIEDVESTTGLGGYGLVLVVDALSVRHGARPVNGGGKVCWADLDARPIGAGR